ncbi:MAG: hypothetical protein JWM95_5278 [Gemmatimonadetes bacterium]|nr:hypothetical protein [Gemmatimonadota bacterium]
MNFRRLLFKVILGLGAVAGAVLPDVAVAQVPTSQRDTIRIPIPPKPDSTGKGDTLVKSVVPVPVVVKPDTVKPPLARADAPVILEIGVPRIYDRNAMFATGAINLGDLLSRVPGLTQFATGVTISPTVFASQGDLRRIRIFLDGLELDPMDRRARGTAAVNDLPLNSLEEVRIERGTDEVRVYARSFRVDRTIPFTRADISTGDQATNFYTGTYGRRYDNGATLQVSAQYLSTQPNNALPSSDALNAFARVGMMHGPWNIDAIYQRSQKNRAPWTGTGDFNETRDTGPGIETHRSTAYLRLANGDVDAPRWFQVVASTMSYLGRERSSTSLSTVGTTGDDSLALTDSASYESQYLITGGINRGPLRTSLAERVRVGEHRTSHSLSGRASTSLGRLELSAFGEGKTYLNPGRIEATARYVPFARVALLAAHSQTSGGVFDRLFTEPRSGAVFDASGVFHPGGAYPLGRVDTNEVTRYELAANKSTRAEGAVRFRDLWIGGGIVRRGATTLLAPAELSPDYAVPSVVRLEGEATGKTASVRGRLWRGVNIDAWALAWDDSTGLYRPRYQTRTELFIQTSLLDRFPKGNFGLLTSLVHEYRSDSRFPFGADSVRIAPGYREVTFKLEIRIQTAVVSYQFRNSLQEKFSQVPGFNFPRQTQFYGVRWEFWN